MNKIELKEKVLRQIEENAERIIDIGEKILKNPEMGYKETKTAKLVCDVLEGLGIPTESGLAKTGVKGRMKGGRSDVTVAVIGELDAVTCPTNPDADKLTGAAHACGHNAQIAAMLGVAMALSSVKSELAGDVCFFATPAEEFVELSYREGLRERGEIEFFGGKQELIRIGAFDDVDMAMMVHSMGEEPEPVVAVGGTSLGFVAKTVDFNGKAAHASTPYDGVNALNAAMSAMMCINSLRETFRDEDKIRIHPIITNGGELVNIVPSKVTLETYVRGADFEAINDAAQKVDRAIVGASYAMGTTVDIRDFKGYLPLKQSESISDLFAENAKALVGDDKVKYGVNMIGSSDIGDLCHIMPTVQPIIGGFVGSAHSKEFKIADKYAAYILPAKIMALTVVDLLFGEGECAKKIKNDFKPLLAKEEYCSL